MLARRNIPLKGHKRIRESRKLHSKPFTCFFSLGTPAIVPNNLIEYFRLGLWTVCCNFLPTGDDIFVKTGEVFIKLKRVAVVITLEQKGATDVRE